MQNESSFSAIKNDLENNAITINVLEKTNPQDEDLLQQSLQDASLSFWSDYPHTVLAQAITNKMTDDELLAQLFMFGWAGKEPNSLIIEWVEQRKIGSIKIFGWNTDDVNAVARDVTKLQQIAQKSPFAIPLYVATDQEGGWIRHIKGKTSDTPGNMAIGASGYPIDSFFSGYYISQELRALGINMNFAPTVDLYTNYNSSVIGPRSFGEEKNLVGILGAAFTEGSLQAGVLPTAKHYPGHGDTHLDSHGRLPIIDIDKEMLLDRELVPFIYLIKEGIPAIMSGHLAFPQISQSDIPASLSRYFLHDILREKLAFKGLIITDDMMMNGATLYAGSMSRAVRLAIEAGNQIICSSTTPQIDESLWTNNLQLMKTNADFKDIVKEAAYSVILSKLQYFKSPTSVPIFPDETIIEESIPHPEAEIFFTEQAARATTFYKKGIAPLTPKEAGRTLLVSQFQQFFDVGRPLYPDAKYYFFRYFMGPNETQWNIDKLLSMANNFDTIIICVANEASAAVAQGLRRLNKNIIIVSSLSPTPVLYNFDWADCIVLAYSYSSYSFLATFNAIAGNFSPKGVLPLLLPKKNDFAS
ncbi:MAG: glycoside hydrolase family 3 protein [Treponemataceae bacterium]